MSELEKQNVVGDGTREETWCQIITELVKPDKDFRFHLRWEVFGLGWWWRQQEVVRIGLYLIQSCQNLLFCMWNVKKKSC